MRGVGSFNPGACLGTEVGRLRSADSRRDSSFGIARPFIYSFMIITLAVFKVTAQPLFQKSCQPASPRELIAHDSLANLVARRLPSVLDGVEQVLLLLCFGWSGGLGFDSVRGADSDLAVSEGFQFYRHSQ